jgi:uncharacterized membrane protein
VRQAGLVRILAVLVLALAAATVVGIVVLWPHDRELPRPEGLAAPHTQKGKITGVMEVRCGAGVQQRDCLRVAAEVQSGPDKGLKVKFTFGKGEGDFGVGDRIRVFKNPPPPPGTDPALQPDVGPYSFSDFERRPPMLWLAVLFAGLVLLTSRWQGLRALGGLAASLLVIVFFIVPAILDGSSPIAVAFIGGLAVMFATLPLAHGLGPKTVAACLGTAVALALTLGLADLFTGLAHLSGVSSEEAAFLRTTQERLSLQGLLVAGMVIAALGVLDDLTVSQSSTVMALRRANPSLGFRPLFRSALGVGHDHIAATVNTLVLAYAGASLPVLLIFSLADTPLTEALNLEAVAEPITATLVGSIGLIAAVPVTTALAAALAVRLEPAKLGRVEHAHAH